MSAGKTVSLLLVFALVFCSCELLKTSKANESSKCEKLPQANQTYPLKEGLSLEVTFENQRAQDASQLGLFMLSKTEDREKVVSVEDAEFFPKYFAIINSNIDDGLLFISEKEARSFVQAAYLQYQSSVTSKVDLQKYRKTHVLTEIVAK